MEDDGLRGLSFGVVYRYHRDLRIALPGWDVHAAWELEIVLTVLCGATERIVNRQRPVAISGSLNLKSCGVRVLVILTLTFTFTFRFTLALTFTFTLTLRRMGIGNEDAHQGR